jgi:FkbM family methyltransferase
LPKDKFSRHKFFELIISMNSLRIFKIGIVKIMKGLAAGPACIASRVELGDRWRAYNDWVRDRGDLVHRLDYSLNTTSTVWDVGGYEGQWASDIFARFGCRIDVFEPVPVAAEFIMRRFSSNPSVCIHAHALGAADGLVHLSLSGDASSVEPSVCRGKSLSVEVRDVVNVWRSLDTTWIDVMKVNIEGAEYALLERLIATGLILQIGELQVQFHDFIPDAVRRRRAITKLLERTHVRTWCYEFVWENWKRIPESAK